MQRKYYDIGEHRFFQDRLTFRQRQWIVQELDGLEIDVSAFTDMAKALSSAFGMASNIGKRLSRCYAIVLIPSDKARPDYITEISNPDAFQARVDFLEIHLEEEPEREVWTDFLSVNQIGSLLERWMPVFQGVSSDSKAQPEALTNSVPSLPEATQPLEMAS